MSLPSEADSAVKRSPVNCIPSPESPAKRITTRSSDRVSATNNPLTLKASGKCIAARRNGLHGRAKAGGGEASDVADP